MKVHHEKVLEGLFAGDQLKAIRSQVRAQLEDLTNIFKGICLIKDLSEKTLATVVSYGERISSLIVTSLICGANHYDSLSIIKTEKQFNKHVVNFALTNELVIDSLSNLKHIAVMGGFISTDIKTGEITNLGRGGSDYTASIVAAALNADILEIWTDVDGFMTADPRVINSAYVINHLTFIEAMELCNFGAKVVYPPTIFPVYQKNIPIKSKNTFNHEAPGTLIANSNEYQHQTKAIKGIS